jgi:sugar lactone lactonase YvrE
MEQHPSGDFLYLAHNGTGAIERLDVDTMTGALTVGTDANISSPNGVAISGDGLRMFASPRGTNELHVWDIAPASGYLTPVAGSPFTIALVNDAAGVDTNEDGSLVVVSDDGDGTLEVFTVDAAGVPTEVAGGPFTGLVQQGGGVFTF